MIGNSMKRVRMDEPPRGIDQQSTLHNVFNFLCPVECSAPNCFFAGKPGPPWWPPEWPGDPDGAPTQDGFCLNYCNEYDPLNAPGSRICGYTQWDPNGIDCSTCSIYVNAPPLPEEDRLPSSGLCNETDNLSGHVLWGSGIRECNNGPEPTDNTRCTIYQGLNGDEVVNAERTCDGFCNHFGLSCLNGYDDGDNGCTYGGEGIGCFVSLWHQRLWYSFFFAKINVSDLYLTS